MFLIIIQQNLKNLGSSASCKRASLSFSFTLNEEISYHLSLMIKRLYLQHIRRLKRVVFRKFYILIIPYHETISKSKILPPQLIILFKDNSKISHNLFVQINIHNTQFLKSIFKLILITEKSSFL